MNGESKEQKLEIRSSKLETGDLLCSFSLAVSAPALRVLSDLCGKSFPPRRAQRHGESEGQKLETGNWKLGTCFVVFPQCLGASVVNKNHRDTEAQRNRKAPRKS
jgi:hypothetical protein